MVMPGEFNDRGHKMLNCYRVLDLCDERGSLCSKTMADLGADVIKVEKPGGDVSRNKGPFYKDEAHPEKSLHWFAFNNNKRGITLDIETADGKAIFKKLVKSADVVIETFNPGFMDGLGLGYSQLSEVNPQIIMTSITGFGQEGPYRSYKSSDLAVWALSGMMFITGDPDRPPLAPSYPHAFLFASVQGAVGTMMALFHRVIIGRGQHVDVSAQMSLVWPTSPDATGMWDISGQIAKRAERIRKQPFTGLKMPTIWPCKDGEVGYAFMIGPGLVEGNKALGKWIESEDPSVTVFKQIDWRTVSPLDISEEMGEEITRAITGLFLKHTKADLFEGSMKRNIRLYPALTPADTLNFEQLKLRDFWQKVEHEELGDTITYPGKFIKSTEKVDITRRRPPLIGEHNREIYHKEMGLSLDDLISLKNAGII
jgi:crotonobetainyl-CoA:carnitine CoA-transferase CaiB-like acyl-CoA transferase